MHNIIQCTSKNYWGVEFCDVVLLSFVLLLRSCRYDQGLKTQVRDVTHSESRSVFHVPSTPTTTTFDPYEDFEVIVSTKQFGVPLERLRERNGGEPIPQVARMFMC